MIISRFLAASLVALGASGDALAWLPRGSAVPFTPPSIAGLQLWLRGDTGCINGSGGACANGDSIATWTDTSAAANNATQATSGNRPTYVTNLRNGHAGISFNGSTQYLNSAYTGDPGTLIIVYYVSTFVSAAGQALMGADTSDAVAVGSYGVEPYGINGYGYQAYQRYTTADSTNAAPAVWNTQSSHTLRLWDIWGLTNNGSTITSFKSGYTSTSTAKPAYTARPIINPIIGGEYYSRAVVSPFNGYIAEIIAYSSALSPTNYAQVIAYLKTKYDMAPTGAYVMAVTQGGAGTGGGPTQSYGDQSLYILRGPDGINWPYVQPSNLVCPAGPGKSVFGAVQFSILKDQYGNAIKSSDGYYWGELSRNAMWAANGEVTPYTTIDIASSPDFFNWTCEASFDFGPSGFNLASGSGANGFNDGWFVDAANGNIYAKFNAANSLGGPYSWQEYSLQITNLAHGAVTFATPIHTTGTTLSSGMYSSYTNLYSGTYYMIWNDQSAGNNQGNLAQSSSPFTGYNTNATISGGTHYEWGQLIQLPSTKYLFIQDNEGHGLEYETVDNPALANPTGFLSVPNPTTNGNAFFPQGPYILNTPSGL